MFKTRSRFGAPLACAIACASLTACGTPASMSIEALDDLSNHSQTIESRLFDFHSYVSIAGVIPTQNVMWRSFQPADASPTHSISLSPKFSYVAVKHYDGATADDVATVANGLQEAQQAYMAAQVHALQTAVLSAALNAKGFQDDAKSSDASAMAAQARRLLGEPLKDTASAEQRLTALRDKQVQLDQALRDKLQQVASASRKANILITRWQATRTTQGGAILGGGESAPISGRGASSGARSGFLVLGNLRMTSLHAGEDFLDMVRERQKEADKFIYVDPDVTTFTLQAKHTAHVEETDARSELALRLRLSADQLKQFGNFIQDSDVGLDFATTLSRSLTNRGALSSPKETIEPRCFYPPRAQYESVTGHAMTDRKAGKPGPSDGFRTVMVVRATLNEKLRTQINQANTELRHIKDSKDPKKKTEYFGEQAVPADLLTQWLKQCTGNNHAVASDYFKGEAGFMDIAAPQAASQAASQADSKASKP